MFSPRLASESKKSAVIHESTITKKLNSLVTALTSEVSELEASTKEKLYKAYERHQRLISLWNANSSIDVNGVELDRMYKKLDATEKELIS